jgi:inner membrane protein
MAAGRGSWRAMLLLAALSLSPDLDVIGFRYGIAYGAQFGHRGATHSLFVAIVVGCLFATVFRFKLSYARAVLLCSGVLATHGLLDSLTDGGYGVALFWPFTARRFFAPIRPIPVAPIGRHLLSWQGLHVLLWEILVFSPLVLYSLWPVRRKR